MNQDPGEGYGEFMKPERSLQPENAAEDTLEHYRTITHQHQQQETYCTDTFSSPGWRSLLLGYLPEFRVCVLCLRCVRGEEQVSPLVWDVNISAGESGSNQGKRKELLQLSA